MYHTSADFKSRPSKKYTLGLQEYWIGDQVYD